MIDTIYGYSKLLNSHNRYKVDGLSCMIMLNYKMIL